MPFQNKPEQRYLSYLAALTLLFSYAELLLPRIVPFFRLGLSNTVIILALGIDFPAFFSLIILKSLAASLMAGTLFSPFLLISLAQSIASGLLMFLLSKPRLLKKIMSIYGISMLGSALSAAVQIALTGLYLGSGTKALLGPMLIFSVFSGLLTAFLAENLSIPKEAPVLSGGFTSGKPAGAFEKAKPVILALMISGGAAAIFMIRSIPVLFGALAVALVLQFLSGRKIMILPHLSLWLFVFASSVFVPFGKVIFSTGFFSVTQGALLSALEKSIKLSAVCALSQCAVQIRPPADSILGLSLCYYRDLMNTLRTEKGNVFHKLKAVLSATELHSTTETASKG